LLRTEDPLQGFGERVHCGGELESCQFFKFERRFFTKVERAGKPTLAIIKHGGLSWGYHGIFIVGKD
jgi:hypothetical protein